MLPEAAQVILKVYSINAQEVATLMSERRDAGIHEGVFDTRKGGRILAPGVYFYRLTAGNFTAARKPVLLK